MRLNIGGTEPKDGWEIFNIEPGPHVDHVGDCTDLSRFADDSCEEVYASHVLEHLDYREGLPQALAEIRRILKPGGLLGLSVPDMAILGPMMADPAMTPFERLKVMTMIFGGPKEVHEFHKVGLTFDIMREYLARAGFSKAARIDQHKLFRDMSHAMVGDRYISLNMVAEK